MKIAFLIQDTGTVYGAQRATVGLAANLLASGSCEPHVVLIEESRLRLPSSALRELIAAANIPWSSVSTGSAFSLDLVSAIRAEARSLGADVVQTVGDKADLHGGLAANWGHRFPIVSTMHGWLFRPDLKERFYGWLGLQALRRFSKVIVLSRFYEDLLLKRGVRRDRLARIPTGVDANAIAPRDAAAKSLRPGAPFTIGTLGRLSWEKNLGLFLCAAKQLKDRGIAARFLVAGEGPERATLEREAAALGLSDVLEMPGYLSSAEFFGRTHVLVQCSRVENLPYSILEAMAWCRPVIATRAGGIPDLVDDGANGFLVADGDADALADRMARLANDRALVEKLGQAGRAKLEREFSPRQQVDRHLELYRSLKRS